MDTIDIRRDPCAETIALGLIATSEAAEAPTEEEGTEPITRFAPGRERPVKYVQHPSYVRFLRPDTLAA